MPNSCDSPERPFSNFLQDKFMKSIRLYTIVAIISLFICSAEAFGQQPKTAQELAQQAATQFSTLNYDGALQSASTCLQLFPQASGCYGIRGYVFLEKKEFAAALADFNKAIELVPGEARYFAGRGDVYLKQERLAEALADYNKAISLDARLADAYLGRSQTYCNSDKLDLAAADEKKVLELGGKIYKNCVAMRESEARRVAMVQAYLASEAYKLGVAEFSKGNKAKAVESFTKAISHQPTEFQAYFYRGMALFDLDKFDEAAADFKRVAELNSKLPELYYYRGALAIKKNDRDTAITELSKAIELNAQFVQALNVRGMTYVDKGQPAQAVADFTKVLTLQPSGETLYRRGHAYFTMRDFDNAILDMNKLIEANPKVAEPYNIRAASYCQLGKKDLAQADEKKVQELGGKVESPCR